MVPEKSHANEEEAHKYAGVAAKMWVANTSTIVEPELACKRPCGTKMQAERCRHPQVAHVSNYILRTSCRC